MSGVEIVAVVAGVVEGVAVVAKWWVEVVAKIVVAKIVVAKMAAKFVEVTRVYVKMDLQGYI